MAVTGVAACAEVEGVEMVVVVVVKEGSWNFGSPATIEVDVGFSA